MAGKTKRSLLAHFLDTTPDASGTAYKKIGDGVTSLTMNYNPNTVTETYIDADAATILTESYAPTIPTKQWVWPGDDIFDFIDGLRQEGPAVLANAATSLVEVRLYETADTAGTSYPATYWPCAIQFDDVGGDGGSSAAVSFTINITGDAVDGDFNTSTLAFTATGS
jgi:hypothetical protein